MKVSDFVHEMRTTSVVFGRETGVYVTFSGDMAYTDGKRINLPSMGLGNKLTPKQVKTMRGYVDHEAGHVRHSDMPRIIDFYKRCANNDKMDLKNLHNCVEDVWMEHKVVECYPGSLKNLAQTNESVSEKEIESWEEHGLKVFDDNALNAGFCIKKSNPMYSGGKFEKCMEYYSDDMKKWAAKWTEQAIACKNSEETIELAMAIWKFFEEEKDMSKENPEDFDPKGGDPMESVGEPGDAEAEEGVGKKGKGKGKKGEGEAQEGTGEGGEKVKLPSDYLPDPASVVSEAIKGNTSDGAGAIGSMGNGDLTGGYRVYDTSKDVTYKRGKETGGGQKYVWDIINDNNVSGYESVKGRISGSINTMSSKLKRALLAKKRIDRDPGRELGRLDSKRLVAAKTGARNVFYQRIDRAEEDTAITLLVDLSGSMGGRKAEVARDCAVALAECLEGSQMPFKIVGFCNKRSVRSSSSKGKFHRYEALDTIVFKDYDATLRTCKGSVARLDDAVGGNNSDYDFIAQEIAILKKRPESRKVLFVLSDGHPAHESDANNGEIIKHCKEAIQDFSKAGGECVGIGICDSAVTQIYKNNVVVNDVNELATTCFTKLSNILIGK